MKVVETRLDGVKIVEPDVYGDSRGFFLDHWDQGRFTAQGIDFKPLQVSQSRSEYGTIRGLHYQEPHAQGKLVTVLSGKILDVVVDIRRGSPTFRQHIGIELDAGHSRHVWVPPGFAHGFAVLSGVADVLYVISGSAYVPDCARTILWSDPELAIEWPFSAPVLSAKDAGAPGIDGVDVLPD